MGCDIHCLLEKLVDGAWIFEREIDIDRNYDLFAVLANVRNGCGSAGCDTGDGFIPICAPAGLPEDVSDEVKKGSDSWGWDGHSHSWHTLKTLLGYDWTQVTKKRGWVSGEEYRNWSRWAKNQGRGPSGYSGGISGPNIQHVSWQEMERRLEENRDVSNHYCLVEWEEHYYESCDEVFKSLLAPMLKESEGDYCSVRIVFWFDN